MKTITKVKVGDNLRGKTITFTSICNIPNESDYMFGIETNNNMNNGYSFLYCNNDYTIGYGDDYKRYFYSKTTSFAINSYTFPDDRDIIVSNVINGFQIVDPNILVLNQIKINLDN